MRLVACSERISQICSIRPDVGLMTLFSLASTTPLLFDEGGMANPLTLTRVGHTMDEPSTWGLLGRIKSAS